MKLSSSLNDRKVAKSWRNSRCIDTKYQINTCFFIYKKMVSKREVLDWPNPYESRSSSSKTYSGYGRFCQGKSGSNTPLVGPFQVSKKWNKYFVILFSVKPILLSSNACWQKFKREKREINPIEGTMAGVRSILIPPSINSLENVLHFISTYWSLFKFFPALDFPKLLILYPILKYYVNS